MFNYVYGINKDLRDVELAERFSGSISNGFLIPNQRVLEGVVYTGVEEEDSLFVIDYFREKPVSFENNPVLKGEVTNFNAFLGHLKNRSGYLQVLKEDVFSDALALTQSFSMLGKGNFFYICQGGFTEVYKHNERLTHIQIAAEEEIFTVVREFSEASRRTALWQKWRNRYR
ncbi:hypothetical protein IT417_01705 [bacterium]|nr:hypothetical protein [bacterium]